MKKIVYILTALVALSACTKEIDWNRLSIVDEPDAVYPEGASIDLVFGIPKPPQTKGKMGDDPIIDVIEGKTQLRVAVFDGSGSLKQYEVADQADPVTTNGYDGNQYFKVNLRLTSSEARLHFIANGPKTVTSGLETALMQQWTTDYPYAAYWQRIILPEGINAYSFSAKNGDADWTGVEFLPFYYIEIDETTFEHISKANYEAHSSDPSYKVFNADIEISKSGRPYYTDSNGLVVNVGDFVNARGDKITNGTGYFQSASISDAVKSVPLVRNFARIKVKQAATAGNFEPTQYYLMNIPSKGTMAPYSGSLGFVPQYSVSRYVKNTETGMMELVSGDPEVYTYVEEYTPAQGQKSGYEKLLESLGASGYTAEMPSTAKLIHTPAEVRANVVDGKPAIPEKDWGDPISVGASTATLAQTPSSFMFERAVPTKTVEPTYLLIGGNLKNVGYRWFKVEMTDENGRYTPIYRDVTYFIEIGQIDGSEGYLTAAEAALGEPVSDVSNSTATQDLTQISDGRGTSMWVEYIDYTGVKPADAAGNGEKVRFLYKVYDSKSETNAALSPKLTNGDPRYTLTVATDDPAIKSITEDAAYSGSDTPDGHNDWRVVTVTLYGAPTSSILHGELLVEGVTAAGEVSGRTLSRTIGFHVMGRQNLTLSATNLPTEAAGQSTTLTIGLPAYLGRSLFPLVLKIEAEKGNLNPDASANSVDLPVDTGLSYFSEKNSWGYLFTINYSDYYDKDTKEYTTSFPLVFKSTKDYTAAAGATGSNETYFSVTDQHDPHYFYYKPDNASDFYDTSKNKAIAHVGVDKPNRYFTVTPATQTVAAEATSATITVKTNGSTTWDAAITGSCWFDADHTSGSLTNQSGNQVVTVYFNKNTEATAQKYEITFTPATGMGQGQKVTVTQRKVLEHHTGTYNLALNNQNGYDNSSFNDNTSGTAVTFENSDGYRTGGPGNRTYHGRYLGGYQYDEDYNIVAVPGTITISAPTGGDRLNGKITKVTLTYYNNQNTQTVTYNPTATGSSKTQWIGSAETVTITMDCPSIDQYQNRNVVSNIAVEYEYYD